MFRLLPRVSDIVYASYKSSCTLQKQIVRGIIEIPEDAIQFSFVRSSGPGGQNVNKVNTKVEARFNVYSATWMPEDVKDRFINLEKNNINTRGEFYITSSEERFQERNREIVMEKIQEKVNRASIKPKERKIRREVSDIVKKNWIEEKRRRSELKQRRKGKENAIEHFLSVYSKNHNQNQNYTIIINHTIDAACSA